MYVRINIGSKSCRCEKYLFGFDMRLLQLIARASGNTYAYSIRIKNQLKGIRPQASICSALKSLFVQDCVLIARESFVSNTNFFVRTIAYQLVTSWASRIPPPPRVPSPLPRAPCYQSFLLIIKTLFLFFKTLTLSELMIEYQFYYYIFPTISVLL